MLGRVLNCVSPCTSGPLIERQRTPPPFAVAQRHAQAPGDVNGLLRCDGMRCQRIISAARNSRMSVFLDPPLRSHTIADCHTKSRFGSSSKHTADEPYCMHGGCPTSHLQRRQDDRYALDTRVGLGIHLGLSPGDTVKVSADRPVRQ